MGRLLSTDPLEKEYPEQTPYQFASNRPIDGIDRLGLQWYKAVGEWVYNQTLFGFLQNSSRTIRAAANGDKHAIAGLISYTGSKALEGKEVFSSGTPQQKEEYITTLALDAASAYALPKLMGSKANTGKVASSLESENALGKTSLSESTSAKPSLTQASANGGKTATSQGSITPIEADGYAIVKDANGVEAGRAFLSNQGELNLTIRTKGTTLAGKGADVFRGLHDFINTNFGKVKSIQGVWRAGEKYGDNLKTFNELVKGGMSNEEAAMKTYTGKMAERLKFKVESVKVNAKDADGNATSVDVIFKK